MSIHTCNTCQRATSGHAPDCPNHPLNLRANDSRPSACSPCEDCGKPFVDSSNNVENMKTRKYGDPPTVAEVIERLQEMPQHLRCYFRPKYHGAMDYVDEIPLHYRGICEMEPDGKPRQVTFLC